MTTYAPLPDDELVRLARVGDRRAFAILYHRLVQRVYATARASAPDGTVARTVTVATFGDLMRHLATVEPAEVREAVEELARRRAAGHTPGPDVPPLTVGAVDAMWRELDRRWPTGQPPGREPGLTVAITVGTLVATLVLGALGASSPRRGTPDPSRTFEAVAVDGGDVDLLPALPRPPEVVVPSRDARPSPTPSPSPEPTPEAPSPEPSPEPTETTASPEAPDQAPVVTISSPRDGETRVTDGRDERGAYATFLLDASAEDDRDAADELTYTWVSDLDGTVLTTRSGTARLYVPEGQLTAQHELRLTVTDTAGNVGSDTVTVVITHV